VLRDFRRAATRRQDDDEAVTDLGVLRNLAPPEGQGDGREGGWLGNRAFELPCERGANSARFILVGTDVQVARRNGSEDRECDRAYRGDYSAITQHVHVGDIAHWQEVMPTRIA